MTSRGSSTDSPSLFFSSFPPLERFDRYLANPRYNRHQPEHPTEPILLALTETNLAIHTTDDWDKDSLSDVDSLSYTASDCSSLRMDDHRAFDSPAVISNTDTHDSGTHSLTHATDSECSSLHQYHRMGGFFGAFRSVVTSFFRTGSFFDNSDPLPAHPSGVTPAGADDDDDDAAAAVPAAASATAVPLPVGLRRATTAKAIDTAAEGSREVCRVEVEVAAAVATAVEPSVEVEAAPVLRRSKRLASRERRRPSNGKPGRCVSTRVTRASVKAGKATLFNSSLA